jgi:hypothetical protein
MARRLFAVAALLSLLLCVASVALWLWSERGGTLKAPPRPSNAAVQLQLSRPLPGVNFTGVALVDVMDFMRDVTGLRVAVDWPALEAAGVGKNSTVNVNLNGVRLGEALALLVQPYQGVVFVTRGNDIGITTRAAIDHGSDFASVTPPSTRPAPRDSRIRETVIGGDRWTVAAEHSVLLVWRNPVDPASAFQPLPPPAARSGSPPATEFAGFVIDHLGYPFYSSRYEVPLWAPVAATALLPLAWVVSAVRRRRRVRAGACKTCGYDLRATPGRCPECGRDVPAPEAPVAPS